MAGVQLLVGGVAYQFHYTYVVQVFAGQRVVEVHEHLVVRDLQYRAVDAVAFGSHHGHGVALEYGLVVELAVDHENLFVELDHMLFVTFAESLVAGEHEVELVALFQAVEPFEHGREDILVHTVNELVGHFVGGTHHQSLFRFACACIEVVGENHKFTGFNFHKVLYRLNG